MHNLRHRVDFDAPLSPSRLEIEPWNSELIEVYVGTISREVYRAVEKIAIRRGLQSVVAN